MDVLVLHHLFIFIPSLPEDGISVSVCEGFQRGLTGEGSPTLNVGGPIPRAGWEGLSLNEKGKITKQVEAMGSDCGLHGINLYSCTAAFPAVMDDSLPNQNKPSFTKLFFVRYFVAASDTGSWEILRNNLCAPHS